MLVDLVGHGHDVVLLAELRDARELRPREDPAGRVVGRVEEECARAAEGGGQLRVIVRPPPAALAQRHRLRRQPPQRALRGIQLVERLEEDHLVARGADGAQADGEALRRAEDDGEVVLGVGRQPRVEGLGVRLDRLAKRGHPEREGILVERVLWRGIGRGGR